MIPSTKVYLGIYTKGEAVVVNYRSKLKLWHE